MIRILFSGLFLVASLVNHCAYAQDDLITPAEIANLSPDQQSRFFAMVPLLERAEKLYEQGKYVDFLPLADKVTKEVAALLGQQHRLTALCYAMQGSAKRLTGDHAGAKLLLEQSLDIRLKRVGERHAETIITLCELGRLYSDTSEFPKAQEVLDRALKAAKIVKGERHADVAEIMVSMGELARHVGEYERSKDTILQAMSIQRATIGEMNEHYATSLNALASSYAIEGDLLNARATWERSYDILRRVNGDRHPNTAIALNNMGLICSQLGDFTAAQGFYEKGLAIFMASLGEKHATTAKAMQNLGEVYLKQKDMTNARKYLERAQAITEEVLGPNHLEVSYTLTHLGKLHSEIGEYETSKKMFERALAISQAKVGKEKLANASILAQLANMELKRGAISAARQYNLEVNQLISQSVAKDSADMAAGIGSLAMIDAGLKDWRNAALGMDDARHRIRKLAVQILPGLSEREILTCLETFDGEFRQAALTLGYVRREEQRFVDLSAGWVINGKGLAEESLARRQAKKRVRIAPPKIDEADPWVELAAVRKAMPKNSIYVDIARLKIRNFQAASEAEYWGAARYLAWVVPNVDAGEVQLIDLGDADSLDAVVKETRDAIKGAMNDGQKKGTIAELGEEEATKLLAQPLAKLAERVFTPWQNHLTGIEHIILSPDAGLWLAPWDALPVGDKDYLIEKYALSFVVSGRDLVTPPTVGKGNAPVIMADPNYDLGQADVQSSTQAVLGPAYQLLNRNPLGLSDNNNLRAFSSNALGNTKAARLSGTAAEAQLISGKVEQIAGAAPLLYTDRYALEGIFKKVAQPKMLVLSTHGYFTPEKEKSHSETLPAGGLGGATGEVAENPLLRCGLLLAGCNQQLKGTEDDGILTGQEIAGSDLRGTELVVLSACETGVGEVRTGDGVAGLRQAFQLAGAQAVVSTLWQIPDRDSALIVNELFSNLAAGESKAIALRNAQLKRIEARRDRFGAAHPFFWAAWTVTGR